MNVDLQGIFKVGILWVNDVGSDSHLPKKHKYELIVILLTYKTSKD